MVHKELFGGAVVVDNFPDSLIDASDLRQIPDNQEVFLYPNSNVSIIVEVLQRVPKQDDMDAVKFHFESLAHDNDAISCTIQLPFVDRNNRVNQDPPIRLRGSQRIRKFNSIEADDVDILIALFRVQSRDKGADVVVSKNIPAGSNVDVKEHVTAFDSPPKLPPLQVTLYSNSIRRVPPVGPAPKPTDRHVAESLCSMDKVNVGV